MHPFVKMDQVAGVEADAEEGIAEMALHDLVQPAGGQADGERLVPLDHRREVGRYQPGDIVADAGRQLVRPGREANGKVEILSGVSAGEKVALPAK